MDIAEVLNQLPELGFAGIFLWLFIRERNRSIELSDSRVELLNDCYEQRSRQNTEDALLKALKTYNGNEIKPEGKV